MPEGIQFQEKRGGKGHRREGVIDGLYQKV
jgi:hypothetical protein